MSKLDGESGSEPASTYSRADDVSKRKNEEFCNHEPAVDDECKFENPGLRIICNSQRVTDAPREYDSTIDERLPDTVTLLTTPDGGKLYLVGTAHFSVESQKDVSMIIQAVQPHIVVVELCNSRVGILHLNEELLQRYTTKLNYQYIMTTLKQLGTYNGLLYILLLRMAAHVAKQLGMAPGGEFRTAFEEAQKIPNCIFDLADRPINITIQRAVRSLSWWETLKFGWYLFNVKGDITKEDVELCKNRTYLLDNMIRNLRQEYPAIEEVFVNERNLYLTYFMQLACSPQRTPNGTVPSRVVGVVGIGHTPGIMELWGKVKCSDIGPIMSIPPVPLSSKILKFTLKASLLTAVVYMGYKVLPVPSGLTIQSIKSSVEGLLKVNIGK